MTQFYYCYKTPAPQALMEKYPHAANYIDGQVIVVGESFADHVSRVVDISMLGIQENDGTEEGVLTKADLDAKVEEFLAGEGSAGVVLSREQGLYLYEKHKPISEDESL